MSFFERCGLSVLYTVQCGSVDDQDVDMDDDDDLEVFNDDDEGCDEQVPVVRPIPQSYMIRPPNNDATRSMFPADTTAFSAQPLTAGDGKTKADVYRPTTYNSAIVLGIDVRESV